MVTTRFGIAFANIGPNVEPDRACELARSAEAAGFESIWTADHIVVTAGYQSTYPYDPSGRLPSGEDAPFPESLIWLAYVARATRTIRLATGILILPERNPVILAKELATLDYLSSGRVTLGIGIGWLREEFEAIGVPYEGRGERLEESVAAMRALWAQECAAFEGASVRFKDVYLRPQPRAGAIPVHIGGHTAIAARRAGRIGDGFFPFGVDRGQLPDLLGTMWAAAEEAGRDPTSIEVTVASFFASDAAAALADVRELVDLGATRVVVPAALFPGDNGDALAHYGDHVIGRL